MQNVLFLSHTILILKTSKCRRFYDVCGQLVPLSYSSGSKEVFQRFNLNRLDYSLNWLLCALPSIARGEQLFPLSFMAAFQIYKDCYCMPSLPPPQLNLLFAKLNIPSSLNLPSHSLHSNCFIIFFTHLWIPSKFLCFLVNCRAQKCTRYPIWSLTRAV